MQPLLRYTKAKKEEIIETIGQMVECESPSDSPAHVNRYVDLLIEHSKDIAIPKLIKSDKYGKHLRLEFKVPGRRKDGRILGIGHSDTVWPLGTLQSMPYRRRKGRLWGPGVLDMKAGIAFFIYAARALRDLDIPARRKIDLLIVSDEEIGSKDSRSLTESEAKRSNCVLVLEPGSAPVGALKTARKGIAGYRLTVHGKAAHAGVDFSSGASAIVEIARQIDRIARFTDLERGTTVNPGVISGGTRTNVTAAEARVDIDVRVTRVRDAAIIDRKMRSLRAFDKRCKLNVEGGLNRPPMERSKAVVSLFSRAKEIGASMGLQLEESSTGGGSDGNFTAALGIPTLDGLGAVGEGAHAINESILIDRIPDRTALLAGLLAGL
jgi:glutamate carboxypeptidase